MERFRVGVLGATGLVGQHIVERLASHPWFEVAALAASERSAGRPYREAARWTVSADPPPTAAQAVRRCLPEEMPECDLVVSGLDSAVARETETRFVEAGFPVVSNSAAHRMEPEVPIVVPEVNASHLEMVAVQTRRTGGGFIVTNPNCTVTGLVLALAPLHRAFGVRRVVVATMQALSGAGMEGPRALDLVDNVIPWIPGEEEKVEREAAKILGAVGPGGIVPAPLRVSAHCHRVGTVAGHLEAVSVELERPADPSEAAAVLRAFDGEAKHLSLPSAPERPVIVREENDRPQPRLDREAGNGMSAVVGRLRPCPVLTLRFEVLSHNAVRGAAGGTLLNAELIAAKGMLRRRAPR